MTFHPTDDELLSRLLAGEREGDLLDGVATKAAADSDLAGRLTAELAFSEWLRVALSSPDETFEADLDSATLSPDELVRRVEDGTASAFECDQVVKRLWESPEDVSGLRRRLAEDEWLRQALSASKGEKAFIESLETRMWAETRRDHFVDDFTKRLQRELSADPEGSASGTVVPFTRPTWGSYARLTAAAAALAFGAFLAAQFAAGRFATPAASIVKASSDVIWMAGAAPRGDGTLRPGLYELKSGVVSMRLAKGGELTVEGPAVFDVGRDAETAVHAGIALARTPQDERGVALRSRGLSLTRPARLVGIDARDEEATEAIVFNGDGGICLTESGRCRDLSQFEAVKADRLRDKLVDVPYNPRAFSKAWAMAAGVEDNLGPVRIELPGSVISAAGGVEGEVRVFLENDSFVPAGGLEVDRLVAGEFALAAANDGESLATDGELRSYLLQLDPASSEDGGQEVETSLTFDHPVVGVIFSSERLADSDAVVGAAFEGELGESRGMDSGSDQILLSEDRRTLNLRFSGDGEQTEQVRVLVALQ